MQRWKKVHRMHLRALLERAVAALAAVFLLLSPHLPARAQFHGADVTQMQVERTDEGVYLSATVRFELPHAVEDALVKGIPMFFVAEAAVFRDRWYWYDKRVAGATRHMRLTYQPLTRKWRLQISPTPIGQSGLVLGQNFDSREEAIAAVQRNISRWRIAEPADIDLDSTHNVDFRFRLDVSQLPRPFQIGAVGQSEWNISAGRTLRLVDAPR